MRKVNLNLNKIIDLYAFLYNVDLIIFCYQDIKSFSLKLIKY